MLREKNGIPQNAQLKAEKAEKIWKMREKQRTKSVNRTQFPIGWV